MKLTHTLTWTPNPLPTLQSQTLQPYIRIYKLHRREFVCGLSQNRFNSGGQNPKCCELYTARQRGNRQIRSLGLGYIMKIETSRSGRE